MFYTSHRKCETRAFDHLYDPLYKVGHPARDIAKANTRSLIKTAPVNVYTSYDSMFSELPHRPRSYYIKQRNPLPTTPTLAESGKMRCSKAEIDRNRMKFLRLPTNGGALKAPRAPTHPVSSESLSINDKSKQKLESKSRFNQQSEPKSRSIGSQTIYREQSAQTKPYLPEINYRPGIESSELFQIAHLIETDSMPGAYETECIRRARKRRQWENALRQNAVNGANNGDNKLICEALEWENWLAREHNFDSSQSMRLQTVKNMLNKRDKLIEIDSAKTIDRSVERLTSEHQRRIERIHKEYERSMRKLKRTFDDETLHKDEKSTISESIRKVRQSNLAQSKKPDEFECSTNFDEIEPIGVDMGKVESKVLSKTHRNKSTAVEIYPGFGTDENLRLIYETLKAYRLKQSIHDEITKQLKLIDKIRNETGNGVEVATSKQKIAKLLEILSKLSELLNQVQHRSIDEFVDLANHKFNAILTESNVNSLLDTDEPAMMIPFMRNVPDNFAQPKTDFTSIYLNDILKRCSELDDANECIVDDASNSFDTKAIVSNTVMDFVWPEVFQRLDSYQQQRKQIKVDLKRLTSEEEAMVESIGRDCVEDIMENLFNRLQ